MSALGRLSRSGTILAAAAATALGLAVPASGSPGGPEEGATLVARFGPRDASFAESVALDARGNAYVSLTVWGSDANTGRVVRVRPSGEQARFGPRFALGPTRMLTGVTVDRAGRVYVVEADFAGERGSRVVLLTAAGARTVATFPAGAWPNGLVAHRGRLYASDSSLGAVWRMRSTGPAQTLHRPWWRSAALRPAPGEDIGANGLAFWRSRLYVVNSSRHSLVRVELGPGGTARRGAVVTRDAALLTADGLVADRRGRLWVTVNGVGRPGHTPHDQRLLQLSRSGDVQGSMTDAAWMNYPTMAVPGRTSARADHLYVLDGAFYGGTPDLRYLAVP